METAIESLAEPSELSSMTATLCAYMDRWGPQSTHTLTLMIELAEAHRRRGDLEFSRRLLESAIRDSARYISRTGDLRMRALERLRELFLQQNDYVRAGAVQKELLECQSSRHGSGHPETLAANSLLATILLEPLETIRVMEA